MTVTPPFADVAFDVPGVETFQYAVPPELDAAASAGALVRAPLGKSVRTGVVVARTAEPKAKRHKALLGRVAPEYELSGELLELGRWVAEYYLCGLGEALCTISFIGFRDVAAKTARAHRLRDPALVRQWLEGAAEPPERITPKQRFALEALLGAEGRPLSRAALTEAAGAGAGVLNRLAQRGILEEAALPVSRDDYYPPSEKCEEHFTLTAAQQKAYAAILEGLESGEFHAYLIHGITSSGKTEVYLQAIAHALEAGRQAIVLVPEIALTPQTVERFRARFGMRVGVYHSRLNAGQKFDLYQRVRAGEVDIVIGARSALFTPFPQLGLIVIDEEPEGSYKQDNPPCYHARDVALVRARNAGACAVLGSATPSLEAYHNACEGKFTLLNLRERHGGSPLPEVKLIDMRREVELNQNPGLFSLELVQAVERRLAVGEQTILFLNRRGYNPIVMCGGCSLVIGCEHCDMIMTHHKGRGRLVCHLCGASRPAPRVCPACGEENLHAIGMGTERIEEEVAAAFPSARCMRIDLDTTSSKFAFLNKWRQIQKGGVDIILGTQMIAKGLDLPKVTLVGVVSADVSLFLADFRAAERAFSLLTQVAGRAGRRDTPGEVLVQTYCPHHYAIQFARTHDFEGFFKKEMTVRRILRFPPHHRLIGLVVSGRRDGHTRRMADGLGFAVRQVIRAGVEDDPTVALLGPAPPVFTFIKNRFRWRLLLRGSKPSVMRAVLRRGLELFRQQHPKPQVRIAIDVDPLDMM